MTCGQAVRWLGGRGKAPRPHFYRGVGKRRAALYLDPEVQAPKATYAAPGAKPTTAAEAAAYAEEAATGRYRYSLSPTPAAWDWLKARGYSNGPKLDAFLVDRFARRGFDRSTVFAQARAQKFLPRWKEMPIFRAFLGGASDGDGYGGSHEDSTQNVTRPKFILSGSSSSDVLRALTLDAEWFSKVGTFSFDRKVDSLKYEVSSQPVLQEMLPLLLPFIFGKKKHADFCTTLELLGEPTAPYAGDRPLPSLELLYAWVCGLFSSDGSLTVLFRYRDVSPEERKGLEAFGLQWLDELLILRGVKVCISSTSRELLEMCQHMVPAKINGAETEDALQRQALGNLPRLEWSFAEKEKVLFFCDFFVSLVRRFGIATPKEARCAEIPEMVYRVAKDQGWYHPLHPRFAEWVEFLERHGHQWTLGGRSFALWRVLVNGVLGREPVLKPLAANSSSREADLAARAAVFAIPAKEYYLQVCEGPGKGHKE